MDAKTTNPLQSPSAETEVDWEHLVAERWADFTKALSIYPLANVRVQESLDAFFAALREAHASLRRTGAPREYEGVAILFRDGRVTHGDVDVEIPDGSNLAWLQARLVPSALAGVEFLPGLEPKTLVAFTQKLLAVFLRRDPDPVFQTLWPDPFPGLTLIDRRFEGSFGGQGGGERPYRGGHASRGLMEGEQLETVRVLLSDPQVAERLEDLSQSADHQAGRDTQSVRAGELLDRIVRLLPAEALKRRETLVEATRTVLAALKDRIEQNVQPGELSEVRDDKTLGAMLYSVSMRHFARAGPDLLRWTLDEMFPENATSPQKLGHVGDEQVQDDTDALLRELADLPRELTVDLSRDPMESRSEQLAVLLHYAVQSQSPRALVGLYPSVKRMLDKPGPDQLDILRAYLEKYGDGFQARSDESQEPAVLTLLKAIDKTSLLRACGVFDGEWVVRVFPQYFVLYLQSLDLGEQKDLCELDGVCKTVGADRMIAAAAFLEAEGRALAVEHVQGLLAQPSVARLPLLRLLLQWHGGRIVAEAAMFLRRLDLPAAEAFLLYQLPGPEYFTPAYLIGLIDLHLGRREQGKLHLAISEALCRHIRQTRDADPRGEARLESIRNLARYPSANSWYLLRELSRSSWIPFLAKEPAVVRRLARSVWKTRGSI